jgi:hypothetical protein
MADHLGAIFKFIFGNMTIGAIYYATTRPSPTHAETLLGFGLLAADLFALFLIIVSIINSTRSK